jgi:aspartate carbamoyltransferase regulatory subunit
LAPIHAERWERIKPPRCLLLSQWKQMSETKKVEGIRVVKISAGTVIDHITAGHALQVLQILGITGKEDYIITLAMNISSSKTEQKDIVKLENRFATLNLIEDGKVTRKTRIQLPDMIDDVITCPNQRCVTNKEREPVTPKFQVVSKDPVSLKCDYCWTMVDETDIVAQFTETK